MNPKFSPTNLKYDGFFDEFKMTSCEFSKSIGQKYNLQLWLDMEFVAK